MVGMRMGALALAACATILCASAPARAGDPLADMMAGKSATKGKKLQKAIEKADAHPLGSEQNPVRAAMPQGQRAYLADLRCSDGKPPEFNRIGNMGIGTFGNIVDAYSLRCEGSEPAASTIYMDMYHAGYREKRAPLGFTLVGSE
jgi:hypothetical protein